MTILIVGAGPSGLVLACVLAESGVPFRIVDRKSGPVRESRAAIVHVRTLELFDRLGVRDVAVARGVPIEQVEVHAKGRRLADFSLTTPELTNPLALPQDQTERLLAEAVTARGGHIEWRTELREYDGGTTAVLRRPDGTDERVEVTWIIGADGASSRVRHALGLGFGGGTYGQTGLLADVTLDGELPPPGHLRLNLTRGGFVGIMDLGNRTHRVFGAVPAGLAERGGGDEVSHDAYATVGEAQIQRWFDEVFLLPARVTGSAWTALFRIHSRLADRFRVGPAFLIGDAAHVHSPAGGQGMNLGIGDAVNLGWKLAMVANGEAHERLLDSYEAERRPVARAVLTGTDRGFALEVTPSAVGTWARGAVAPRLVRPLLRLRPVRDRLAQLFAQTWIHYRGSPIVSGPGAGNRVEPGTAPADLRHHLQERDGLLRLIRPDGHIGFIGPMADLAGYLDRVYGQPDLR
jgi:2-polyprenyl-6-methoxyphenol hydroxylase-like FAD-dependent oxidoreductase